MNRDLEKAGDVTLMKPVSHKWVLRSMENSQEFALTGEMLVGREAECQIPVFSGHISRYHAKIRVTSSGVLIEDLHSTNGTFVNGRRISAPKLLSMGDEVVFHTERFRLVGNHSGDAEATILQPSNISLMSRRASEQRSSAEVSVSGDRSGSSAVSELAGDASSALESSKSELSRRIDKEISFETPNLTVAAEDSRSEQHNGSPYTPASITGSKAFRALPQEPSDDATRLLSVAEIALKADRAVRNTSTARVPGNGARLVVMSAPLRGQVLPLAPQKLGITWRVGRGESCELRIDEGTVSHDHARIVRGADGWHIAVTSARNAMVVNGEVETSHALRNGDRLLLGRMEIVFATDMEEEVPLMLPPKTSYLKNPWVLGGLVFTGVTALGVLGVLLLS